MDQDVVPCDRCDGSRHIKTERGWERCPCLQVVLDRIYIKPQLRGGRERWPDGLEGEPIYPLQNLMLGGSWQMFQPFKDRVWRSLVAYRPRGLTYDYIDAFRLVDIAFEKDEEYKTLRGLSTPGLLIVILGMADIANKMLPSLMQQLYMLRFDAVRPTWTFAPFDQDRIAQMYGRDFADMVGPVYPVAFSGAEPETQMPLPVSKNKFGRRN